MVDGVKKADIFEKKTRKHENPNFKKHEKGPRIRKNEKF